MQIGDLINHEYHGSGIVVNKDDYGIAVYLLEEEIINWFSFYELEVLC